MHSVDVSIIAISLNSRGFLRDCIASLRQATWRHVSWELIVVDNGSSDGTPEMLRQEYPDVVLVANPHNAGYCAAGNQGADAARGRYLMFVNDDILILDDAIASLVEWSDLTGVAMVGPKLLNTDGSEQFSSGRRFTTPAAAFFGRKSILTRLFPDASWAREYLMSDEVIGPDPYEVDWLSAAAMMVRADVFERAGRLAEDFYYFHEQVFCARLKNAGYQVFLYPASRIIHHEGVGSGVRTRRVRRRHILAFHSAALKWFSMHHGLGPFHPMRAVTAIGLFTRAWLLVALDAVKPERPHTATQLQQGRPEGGVAL